MRRKLILTAAALVAVAAIATAALSAAMKEQAVFTAEEVFSTGSAFSSVIKLTGMDPIESFAFQCTSQGGTADVRLEYAECLSTDTATCQSFDTNTDIVNSSNTDLVPHPEEFKVVPAPYIAGQYARFKLLGIGSNANDTVCTVSILSRDYK